MSWLRETNQNMLELKQTSNMAFLDIARTSWYDLILGLDLHNLDSLREFIFAPKFCSNFSNYCLKAFRSQHLQEDLKEGTRYLFKNQQLGKSCFTIQKNETLNLPILVIGKVFDQDLIFKILTVDKILSDIFKIFAAIY